MQYTDNFGLRLPQGGEPVKRQDINYNATAIDGIMADNRKISLKMYDSAKTYKAGQIRGHEISGHTKAYKCNTDNTTGVWDSTYWDETDLATEIEEAASSGGVSQLSQLSDVNISNLANGQTLVYNSTSGKWENAAGGGGGNEQELTYAQYLALTDAQRANGTNYFVTDINGDGQDFQPIIYSDTEREIGVWTDGKPLYQKTIHTGALSTGDVSVAHNISNLGTIVSAEGMFSWSNKQSPFAMASRNSTTWNVTIADIQSSNITFEVGSSYTGIYAITDSYVTLTYTKSTDTEGSGTWTPQGVPAVHYSTDEHVVGTWIDGSTLYERTIVNNSPSAISVGNYKYYEVALVQEALSNVMFVDGFVYDTTDSRYYALPYDRYYSNTDKIVPEMFATSTAVTIAVTTPASAGITLSKITITIRYTKSSS